MIHKILDAGTVDKMQIKCPLHKSYTLKIPFFFQSGRPFTNNNAAKGSRTPNAIT